MPTAPETFPTGDDGPRPLQALEVALQLRVPQRQLQPERHRLGVHAVRAAHHRRARDALRRARERRRAAPSTSLMSRSVASRI